MLTTGPRVAAVMQPPPRPLGLSSTTRPSPLVQTVHTAVELKVRERQSTAAVQHSTAQQQHSAAG